MIVVFLQRLDARSSPADKGSACVLHYDEVAATGCTKGGWIDAEKDLVKEKIGFIIVEISRK